MNWEINYLIELPLWVDEIGTAELVVSSKKLLLYWVFSFVQKSSSDVRLVCHLCHYLQMNHVVSLKKIHPCVCLISPLAEA